jgi:DnaK suppressor protein
MAFFKAKLQALEKELLKNAGETTEHLRETVLVPDPADRATIEEEHALELRTRDRERKLLKKSSNPSAIDGDYGWCEETGEPIGIPRLIARPTATLSLEAQQRRELNRSCTAIKAALPKKHAAACFFYSASRGSLWDCFPVSARTQPARRRRRQRHAPDGGTAAATPARTGTRSRAQDR